MIGIDLIAMDRIADSVRRFQGRFLNRFLSAHEQSLFMKIPSIAGAWAAKEACAKALGVGIGAQLGFLDMELSKDSRGAPLIRLCPERRAYFQIRCLHVSISHDRGFAIAVVFAQV